MLNLLNEISSLWVGIISIVILLLIIAVTTVVNLKMKKSTVFSNAISFLLSLVIAIFLCKPLLSLFDKMFSFSTIFFNAFMLEFGQINSLNVQVTMTNYTASVNNFKDASVGISDTLKSFLVKVFENTTAPSDTPTTLGAIASMSVSYMFALFIVALILFIVSFILIKVLMKFIKSKIKKEKNSSQKVLCAIIGVAKSLVISLIVLISVSSLPILGISTDYFANGFETTKVLYPLYSTVVKAEQDIYINSIDFTKVNRKIYQSKDNLEYGIYQNDIEGAEHRVNVSLTNLNATVNILNFTTSTTENYICSYIYANNTLYMFNSGKLMYVFQYNAKDKKIKYKTKSYNKNAIYVLSLI